MTEDTLRTRCVSDRCPLRSCQGIDKYNRNSQFHNLHIEDPLIGPVGVAY